MNVQWYGVFGFVLTALVSTLIGLFLDEILGPRPRIALGRWKRQIGRFFRDDPVTGVLHVRLDTEQPIDEPEAERKVLSVIRLASFPHPSRLAEAFSGSVQQGRTTVQYRIRPIPHFEEEENDFVGRVDEGLRIDSFALELECQLPYRRFHDALSDVLSVFEKFMNLFHRERVHADLRTRAFSIDISALPELSGFFALLQTSSFTANIRNSTARLVYGDTRLDVEGPLDSTTLRVVRDAILYGF